MQQARTHDYHLLSWFVEISEVMILINFIYGALNKTPKNKEIQENDN